MKKINTEEIIGKKFGIVKIMSYSHFEKSHHYYNVICKCGKKYIKRRDNIVNNNSKKCNCNRKIHGHTRKNKRTPTYDSWFNMKQRCLNINHPHYKNYGFRGINVCKKWMEFVNFLKDMGERPEGMTLDRIDNDKGYYKENCRWATRKQQNKNRRDNLTEEIINERNERKRKEKKRREIENKRKKENKINEYILKLKENIIPYQYIKKIDKYKVICKCKRTFLVERILIKKTKECSFCKNKRIGNNFIKPKINDNLKKALDILYEKKLIDNYELPIIIVI